MGAIQDKIRVVCDQRPRPPHFYIQIVPLCIQQPGIHILFIHYISFP
jgi:hypothetical protein